MPVRVLRDAHVRHEPRHGEVPVANGAHLCDAVLLCHLVQRLKVVLKETQHADGARALAHVGEAHDVHENNRHVRVVACAHARGGPLAGRAARRRAPQLPEHVPVNGARRGFHARGGWNV